MSTDPPPLDPAITDPVVDTTDVSGWDDVRDAFKVGWHTSEFWMGLAVVVASTTLLAWQHGKPFSQQVLYVGPIVFGAAWAWLRTWLKTRRLKAITAQQAAQAVVAAGVTGVAVAVPDGWVVTPAPSNPDPVQVAP